MKDKRVSIIIATYNSFQTLENTLKSCIYQKKINFELIVIDGNSQDKTVEVISNYKKNVDFFISEKDKGIYDAWNKGLNYASGDWICFLGSDDIWFDDHSLFELLRLDNGQVNFISSKSKIVNEKNNNEFIIGKKFDKKNLNYNIGIAHSGALHGKILFKKFGFFNSDFKISGDYEFLLRCSNHINAAFYDKVSTIMMDGGISRKKPFLAFYENFKALKKKSYFMMISASVNLILITIKYSIKRTFRLK
jgi:glycosyltransferase involved in cell wall biosynthesis